MNEDNRSKFNKLLKDIGEQKSILPSEVITELMKEFMDIIKQTQSVKFLFFKKNFR